MSSLVLIGAEEDYKAPLCSGEEGAASMVSIPQCWS